MGRARAGGVAGSAGRVGQQRSQADVYPLTRVDDDRPRTTSRADPDTKNKGPRSSKVTQKFNTGLFESLHVIKPDTGRHLVQRFKVTKGHILSLIHI